jgi:hypothetical protein
VGNIIMPISSYNTQQAINICINVCNTANCHVEFLIFRVWSSLSGDRTTMSPASFRTKQRKSIVLHIWRVVAASYIDYRPHANFNYNFNDRNIKASIQLFMSMKVVIWEIKDHLFIRLCFALIKSILLNITNEFTLYFNYEFKHNWLHRYIFALYR